MNLFHPERYHGHNRRPPYFEGWYYKIVDAAEQHRYAFIPAVFKSKDPDQQHSFVQILDGNTGTATYHRYPAAAFHSPADRFHVRVDRSTFSAHYMILSIDDEQATAFGTLTFGPTHPWPVTVASPGIMGPFAWIPFMECNHGVVSFDHRLHGTLTLNGRTIDFTGGRGYIEKDWGASFPAGYLWMQTNHFAHNPGTSLIASIALIPLFGFTFPGFIVGVRHHGRLYRFATYTGARTTHLHITDERVEWTMQDGRYRLDINAQRAKGGLLYGPNRHGMGERVGETMQAEVSVTLTDRRLNKPILTDTGRNAGLEAHGDLDRLLGMQK